MGDMTIENCLLMQRDNLRKSNEALRLANKTFDRDLRAAYRQMAATFRLAADNYEMLAKDLTKLQWLVVDKQIATIGNRV